MQKLGFCAEDKLAVECTQDTNYLVCALACELSCVVFVLLEKHASNERVQDIIETMEPKCLVCENQYQTETLNIPAGEFYGWEKDVKGEVKIDEKNTIEKPVTPASEGYGNLWKRLHDALEDESAQEQ